MSDDDRLKRAKLAREEARETLSEQAATLSDIDEKAMQIFRANVVLTGIIVSGVSIAVQANEADTTAILNPFTKFGAVLLFTATVLASATYTSTSEEIGVSSDDITENILNRDYKYTLVEEGLAEEYSSWISQNYRSNVQNALLFTLTLLATVMAICYFFLGAIEIYRNSLPWYTNLGVGVVFAVIVKISGLRGQLKRWYRETNPQKRFLGWLGGLCSQFYPNRVREKLSEVSDRCGSKEDGETDDRDSTD
ncbi:hypothetical protein [Halorussus ruber]|uniref:hypothetical protein n=1 Tax=Halorussus ruber TaxID=1126238 RepID=UPI001092F028|nr:hypothetical protein [Halorussus ruber]